ncbi:hypothetical protein [Salinispora tropica]|uniref:deazapurine DNA modification protein DpdA family protein n=1 Tax=Salinispora tropica TaxID=168695 RepID=UPI00048D3D4C|nr:hypothetical protein [Salinispora tropica]
MTPNHHRSPQQVGTQFYLGTHHPGWLSSAPVPLFISDRRLRSYKRLPRAIVPWALDSGGFTELSQYGSWDHGPTPADYIARIHRYWHEVGHLAWAAPQDWMCEPWITANTGLTITEHHHRTVDNYQRLRDLAAQADLPADIITPVLQGWEPDDYLRCADLYAAAGVDLTTAPLVGLGTVCRRQGTTTAGHIITGLHTAGITRLHGFGFKVHGLARYANHLVSADSLAWSYTARRRPPLPGCTTHINCANCPRFAYQWHTNHIRPILNRQPTRTQPPLFAYPTGTAA